MVYYQIARFSWPVHPNSLIYKNTKMISKLKQDLMTVPLWPNRPSGNNQIVWFSVCQKKDKLNNSKTEPVVKMFRYEDNRSPRHTPRNNRDRGRRSYGGPGGTDSPDPESEFEKRKRRREEEEEDDYERPKRGKIVTSFKHGLGEMHQTISHDHSDDWQKSFNLVKMCYGLDQKLLQWVSMEGMAKPILYFQSDKLYLP